MNALSPALKKGGHAAPVTPNDRINQGRGTVLVDCEIHALFSEQKSDNLVMSSHCCVVQRPSPVHVLESGLHLSCLHKHDNNVVVSRHGRDVEVGTPTHFVHTPRISARLQQEARTLCGTLGTGLSQGPLDPLLVCDILYLFVICYFP